MEREREKMGERENKRERQNNVILSVIRITVFCYGSVH